MNASMPLHNMDAPSAYLTSPPRSLFKFPPDDQPYALPPPSDASRIAAPFKIDTDFYHSVLRPQLPITFAVVYIAVVLSLNAFNRSRKWKPWWISRTRVFTPLVATHNLLLAVFSGLTFFAMVRAIHVSTPDHTAGTTSAHYADALCKINGPRGLGDAVSFDSASYVWSSNNALIKLAGGSPDSTDVGRIWNEGLAFWGWVFYLSKFYEVIDTLIILARGKRSPTLQTYHHAGAMMCMWAGIRYMAPPIMLFVLFNSCIHTMMYIYYTLATLNIKVPKKVKQTLTVLQISQFVLGATLATFYLFVKYDVPVTTVHKVMTPIHSIASAASSKVSSFAHEVPSITSKIAHATPAPALTAAIKRLLLRAVGNEGVAENIRGSYDGRSLLSGIQNASPISTASASLSSAAAAIKQEYREVTHHNVTQATVNCIDTSGQAFAIWLNVIYLAPLTVLFLRFFVKAYINGSLNKGTGQRRRTSFTDAATRAMEDVRRETDNAGSEVERRLSEQVRGDIRAMRDGLYDKKTDRKTNVKPEAKKDGKIDQKSENKTEQKKDSQPAQKSSKPEQKTEKSDAKSEIKAEQNANNKTPQKTSDKSEQKAATKPDQSATKPDSKTTNDDLSKSASNTGLKPKLSDSHPHLSESAIEDGSGDSEMDSNPSGSPSKSKKKRNKKKKGPAQGEEHQLEQQQAQQAALKQEGSKTHDAAHAGEDGTASYVDVTKEGQ